MRSSTTAAGNRAAVKRWALELTTIGLLGVFAAQAAVPNAGAANVNRAYTGPWVHQVVDQADMKNDSNPRQEKRRNQKSAETYQERQERIAKQKRSMLPELAENEGKETTCVSGEFTTMSVVFDSITDSLLPLLPAEAQASVMQNADNVREAMKNIHVSSMALSVHPHTRGQDNDDPQNYRTPLSQIIVDDLLKIRDGQQNDAIPVGNITIKQAVESTWLYLFVGVLAPLRLGTAFVPNLGSPFSAAPAPLNMLSGFVGYDTLISLVLSGATMGLQYLYQGTSGAMLNQCVAQVTQEQKDQAGQADPDVKYDIPVAQLIQEAADQLALADNDTCAPVGDQSLGRIIRRTGDYAKAQVADQATKNQLEQLTQDTLRQMKATPIPHNLIPADPSDFTSIESILSTVGGFIPYVGGAPIDIILGLSHNNNRGDSLGEVVSLHDLTVTKSLTAAYYTYQFSLYLFTTVGGLLSIDPIQVLPADPNNPKFGTLSPLKPIAAILGLPLTYGLVTYHNVLRSMCFREDDTTGTGLGAEANKLAPEEHEKAVKAKKAEEKAKKKAEAEKAKARRSKPSQTPKTPSMLGPIELPNLGPR